MKPPLGEESLNGHRKLETWLPWQQCKKQWKDLKEKCSKKSHLLELWADGVDLMDNVLHSMDAVPCAASNISQVEQMQIQ